jgi:hypothetical protein
VIGNQSNLKNAIWKWGGHPQVLKSPELIALEGELLAIGKSVESPLVVAGICAFLLFLHFLFPFSPLRRKKKKKNENIREKQSSSL